MFPEQKRDLSRVISTASMSTTKVNLLKALDHAIDEFVDHDINGNSIKIIMLLTSQFDFPSDKKKLDLIIKKLHALKIHLVILGYDIGDTVDTSGVD